MKINKKIILIFVILILFMQTSSVYAGSLAWPIDCTPGKSCQENLGFPDIDKNGIAYNCGETGRVGHEGTDIVISWKQMDRGIAVFAAEDGEVLWVFDEKYDRCPASHNDCQSHPDKWFVAGQSKGFRVCTELGPYCRNGKGSCFWCFDGGNVVVIKHYNVPGVFATRYDHLKLGSTLVKPGMRIRKGQKIAEAGSAGQSTDPHLHFEVWGDGFYTPVDPWSGRCGSNIMNMLWQNDPPWK